mmetsp:Transcript_60024/g.131924  ORF Transcript_60024/g.131924 Transcript_60024/m.131924 type:complete len:717 (+) Transcript_60024:63-2213(+)
MGGSRQAWSEEEAAVEITIVAPDVLLTGPGDQDFLTRILREWKHELRRITQAAEQAGQPEQAHDNDAYASGELFRNRRARDALFNATKKYDVPAQDFLLDLERLLGDEEADHEDVQQLLEDVHEMVFDKAPDAAGVADEAISRESPMALAQPQEGLTRSASVLPGPLSMPRQLNGPVILPSQKQLDASVATAREPVSRDAGRAPSASQAGVKGRDGWGVYLPPGWPASNLGRSEVKVARTMEPLKGVERHTGERLTKQPSLELGPRRSTGSARPMIPGVKVVTVNTNIRYQTFLGFGGSFTETAGELFKRFDVPEQDSLIKAYFATGCNSHHYQVCRVPMTSNDFSRGKWTCCDSANDPELKNFTLDNHRKFILPLLRAAKKWHGGKSLQLIASPWSPPAWMKNTSKMLAGGKVKGSCYGPWAKYFVKFAQEMEKENFPIWAMTVQNEPLAKTPWENCLWNAVEERDFIRDHLGPLLFEELDGEKPRLLLFDHNRDEMLCRVQTILDDPRAARYIGGAAFHWYGDPRYELWPNKGGQVCHRNVGLVHDLMLTKYPDTNMHLVMTEACHEGVPEPNDWRTAFHYAEHILKDLVNWTEAWIDWNLWLDASGGPNHTGNYCSSPIIVDAKLRTIRKEPSYYAIGQFSRYIQPGSKRILCGSSLDDLETVAFLNPDDTVAVVVLNRSEVEISFWLELDVRRELFTVAAPRSITTYLMNRL